MIRKLTITPVSSNRKTGNIAVTGRDRSTCPTSCTFYDNGCYTTGRIDGYLNQNDLAAMLRIKPESLRQRYNKGNKGKYLPPRYKIDGRWYWLRTEVEEWFARQTSGQY